MKRWKGGGERWMEVCRRLHATDTSCKLGKVADSVRKRGWVGAHVPQGVCPRGCSGARG